MPDFSIQEIEPGVKLSSEARLRALSQLLHGDRARCDFPAMTAIFHFVRWGGWTVVVEDVAGVPAGLDLLEPGIIILVVQRVPGDPGGVPLWISQIDVGVVDQGAVTNPAGHGHATGVRKRSR